MYYVFIYRIHGTFGESKIFDTILRDTVGSILNRTKPMLPA